MRAGVGIFNRTIKKLFENRNYCFEICCSVYHRLDYFAD